MDEYYATDLGDKYQRIGDVLVEAMHTEGSKGLTAKEVVAEVKRRFGVDVSRSHVYNYCRISGWDHCCMLRKRGDPEPEPVPPPEPEPEPKKKKPLPRRILTRRRCLLTAPPHVRGDYLTRLRRVSRNVLSLLSMRFSRRRNALDGGRTLVVVRLGRFAGDRGDGPSGLLRMPGHERGKA